MSPEAAPAQLIHRLSVVASSIGLLTAWDGPDEFDSDARAELAQQLRTISSAVLLTFDDRKGLHVSADALQEVASRWRHLPPGVEGKLSEQLTDLAAQLRRLAESPPAS